MSDKIELMILGIDEVGRGPWAGPLVVGAVVLSDDPAQQIDGLTDSKKLSKKRRDALDGEIRAKSAGYGLGWVHADEIDEIGLGPALRLATIRAVEQVTASYYEIIIDGTINFLSETNKGQFVTTLAKADLLIPSVSAASIIAKVARDRFMAEQDAMYEGYGFSSHVGYGTAKHRAAINALGVTPLHRLSFAPLMKYRQTEPEVPPPASKTTKSIGDRSETVVAQDMVRKGFTILDRNWRTRYCEIDIVATKDSELFIVEVKHRTTSVQGGGIAAVTAKKLQQLRFAAQLYTARHHLHEQSVRFLIYATEQDPPVIIESLEIE